MTDVVGVGTNSVDEILLVPGLPECASGGKVRATGRHVLVGGQTATLLGACAALGLRTRYVGAFGSDENGALIRHALESRGVDLTYASSCLAPNRGATILVDPHGQRTVVWHRAENLRVDLSMLTRHALQARIVHVDDDDPDVALEATRLARRMDRPVTSDLEHPSPVAEQLVEAVTYPILEQHLLTYLTGERDAERALRKLRRLNPGVLCVTLGEAGSAALDGDRFEFAAAVKVDAVDTTGAGDVFRAGYIFGILQGWPVARLLRFANAAAAVSCTRLGALDSVPSRHELELA